MEDCYKILYIFFFFADQKEKSENPYLYKMFQLQALCGIIIIISRAFYFIFIFILDSFKKINKSSRPDCQTWRDQYKDLHVVFNPCISIPTCLEDRRKQGAQ